MWANDRDWSPRILMEMNGVPRGELDEQSLEFNEIKKSLFVKGDFKFV